MHSAQGVSENTWANADLCYYQLLPAGSPTSSLSPHSPGLPFLSQYLVSSFFLALEQRPKMESGPGTCEVEHCTPAVPPLLHISDLSTQMLAKKYSTSQKAEGTSHSQVFPNIHYSFMFVYFMPVCLCAIRMQYPRRPEAHSC